DAGRRARAGGRADADDPAPGCRPRVDDDAVVLPRRDAGGGRGDRDPAAAGEADDERGARAGESEPLAGEGEGDGPDGGEDGRVEPGRSLGLCEGRDGGEEEEGDDRGAHGGGS